MTEPVKPTPPPRDHTNNASAKTHKPRSSKRLIGLFRPSPEQLASDEEFEQWAERVSEIIMREVGRVRASLDQKAKE